MLSFQFYTSVEATDSTRIFYDIFKTIYYQEYTSILHSHFSMHTTVKRPKWIDCIFDKIFKEIEIVKFITTTLKSILKFHILNHFVTKPRISTNLRMPFKAMVMNDFLFQFFL